MRISTLTTTLACSLVLAACGGGGGGGGSGDYSPGPYGGGGGGGAGKTNAAIAEGVIATAPVEVDNANTPLNNGGVYDTSTFPLYEYLARVKPADADAVSASLASSADGKTQTLAMDIDNARTPVEFSDTDIKNNLPSMIRYEKTQAGDRYVLQMEGLTLDYARYGLWGRLANDAKLGKDDIVGVWFSGLETPQADMPATGNFTYAGKTSGITIDSKGEIATLSGDLNLIAEFATGKIQGTIRNISVNGGGSQLGAILEKTDIQSNGFKGNLTMSDGATKIGNGAYDGRFFGKTAEEVAGKWEYSATDGSSIGMGSFGAAKVP